MKRRVIKQGNNTLTITLPRKWAEKHGIKAGEEVEVEEEVSRLIIDPRKERISRSAEFHLASGEDEYVNQVLRNLYNSDIEELELSYAHPDTLRVIQKYAPRYLGWEFLEQNEKHCRIRNYATLNEENFQEMYRKSFLSIANILETLSNDLKYKKNTDAGKIAYMNDTTFRFANYCRRMLIRKSPFPPSQARAHSHLLTNLAIISNILFSLAKYLEKNELKAVPSALIQYFGQVAALYHKMHTIFLQKNGKDLPALAAGGRELQNEGLAMLEKSKGVDSVILHYLITVTMFIRHQGGRLMVIAEKS